MGKKHSNVKKNGESKGPSSSLDIFKTLFGEITEKGPSSSIFFDDNGNKKMAPSETSVFPLSPNGNPIWTSSTSSAHSSVSKLITSAISGNILSSIWPTPRCASPLLLTTSTLSTPPSSVDSAASSSATTPTGALSSAANPTSGSPIHSAMDTKDGSDKDDDDDSDKEDEQTPQKVQPSKKRAMESAKTPVTDKKAKLVTPQKAGKECR